jgi:hypothetical protein
MMSGTAAKANIVWCGVHNKCFLLCCRASKCGHFGNIKMLCQWYVPLERQSLLVGMISLKLCKKLIWITWLEFSTRVVRMILLLFHQNSWDPFILLSPGQWENILWVCFGYKDSKSIYSRQLCSFCAWGLRCVWSHTTWSFMPTWHGTFDRVCQGVWYTNSLTEKYFVLYDIWFLILTKMQ